MSESASLTLGLRAILRRRRVVSAVVAALLAWFASQPCHYQWSNCRADGPLKTDEHPSVPVSSVNH